MDSANNSVQKPELQNHIRIQILLSRATVVLRKLFLKRWRESTSIEWNSKSTQLFVSGIGKKVLEKVQKIQRESILLGDVSQWDITTVTDMLLLTTFPQTNLRPSPVERSMLEELKKVRNIYAHNPGLGLDNEKFESLWEKASQVMAFFGSSLADLDELKSSPNLGVFQNENSSGNIIKANSEDATRLKTEANILYNDGLFNEAIDIYSKAIKLPGLLESELATLYSNRSAAYLAKAKTNKSGKQEDLHCALQDGKKTVELNPTWYRGYFRTGNAYLELNEVMTALENFDSAVSLSPGRVEVVQARDNCRMKANQDFREEHLDPSRMPKSEEEQIRELQQRFGHTVDRKILAKAADVYSNVHPGGSFVSQAHSHMRGIDRPPDHKFAATLYAKAATLGNAEGIYNLGILYKIGSGVKQDFEMSNKLMREAAEKPPYVFFHGEKLPNVGVAEAEHSLGMNYAEGIGVNIDFNEAAYWYKRSSDHGCSNASNNLAFLYQDGKGVELSLERAVQFWKLSAAQGNALAMRSLAYHYFREEQNPQEARIWQGRAIKNGNLEAQLHAAEFEKELKNMEKNQKEILAQLEKWEKENGVNSGNLKLKARIDRMLKTVDPDATAVLDGMGKIYLNGVKQSSSPLTNHGYNFDPIMLMKYAKQGSQTAARILAAKEHCNNALNLVGRGDYTSNLDQIVHELAECYRLEELVVPLYPPWKDIWTDIVAEVLQTVPENTKSQLDIDARVCYAHLYGNNYEHLRIFAERSKQKYPDEREFHQVFSNMCGFLQKYNLGLKELKEALKIFPNEYNLLYAKAVHTRLDKKEASLQATYEVIKAYEEYLAAAPKDNRKVPEALYCIANQYFLQYTIKHEKDKNMKGKRGKSSKVEVAGLEGILKMDEYYQLGLDAEKIQLPCFMPYKSNSKDLIINRQPLIKKIKSDFYKVKNKKGKQRENALPIPRTPPQPPPRVEPDFVKLTDPNRILVIKNHRQVLQERKELTTIGTRYQLIPGSTPGANVQKAPSQLSGLNPIFFTEIDTSEDKVYEGRVVQVTSIEDAGFGGYPSIRLVLEDERGDLLRAFVYNFPEKDDKMIQEKLGFGAKMSIMNPYMRLAADGSYGLRVDDSASLFFHSSSALKEGVNRCRFCGNANANLNCANCKFAQYYSRKCQEMDWKLTKHKLICTSP